MYEGEFLDGKENGWGKIYKDNIQIFEGEFLKGEIFKGKGKRYNEKKTLTLEFEFIAGYR